MNRIHDLARVDLNLLVAFVALHERGSVTAAAADLGVTQSAMSHTLGRLRTWMDDPLFVRQGRRMVPTPRSLALIGPIRGRLEGLARALAEPDGFDPNTSRRRFVLATVDLFEALVIPRLAASFAKHAPGIGLIVRPHDRDTVTRLDAGELDAAIHPIVPGAASLPSAGLRARVLLRDGWCVFVRSDHPSRAALPEDIDAYAESDHLLVSPGSGPGLVDGVLSELGRSRRIAVTIHQFASALATVAATDLVLTAPAALAQLADARIAVLEPPIPLPDHAVALLWSERVDADPGHAWFRRRIVSVARAEIV